MSKHALLYTLHQNYFSTYKMQIENVYHKISRHFENEVKLHSLPLAYGGLYSQSTYSQYFRIFANSSGTSIRHTKIIGNFQVLHYLLSINFNESCFINTEEHRHTSSPSSGKRDFSNTRLLISHANRVD